MSPNELAVTYAGLKALNPQFSESSNLKILIENKYGFRL